MAVDSAEESVDSALGWARRVLRPSPSASLDAHLLLAHALTCSRAWLLAHGDETVAPGALASFQALVRRRRAGEPVAYLRGFIEWYGLELEITPGVLVPRPETELMVEEAVRRLAGRPNLHVADVGTGSGAIAIALASQLPSIEVAALDASSEAVELAERNVARHGFDDRLRVHHGDLLDPVADQPDLVVANLPYLSARMMATLDPDVRHEPAFALYGGPSGLELYDRLFQQLRRRSWVPQVIFEFDPRQSDAAQRMARRFFPRAHVSVRRDYAGHDRMAVVESGQS